MKNPDELIPVGKIISTHGIKGELKLYSYSGNIDSLKSAGTIILSNGTVSGEFALNRVSGHGTAFILALNDLRSIEQVQHLVGSELCLKRTQLPPTDDDEYYWRDLIGLSVITDQGLLLGTIEDIFETGSSDIYVVRNDKREYLVPAIADVISRVDIPGNRMIITPLDGLLDL